MSAYNLEYMTKGKWPNNHINVEYHDYGSPLKTEDVVRAITEAFEEICFYTNISYALNVSSELLPADIVPGHLTIGWDIVLDPLNAMAQTRTRYKRFDQGIVGARMTYNTLFDYEVYKHKLIGNTVHELGHAIGFKHAPDDVSNSLFTVMATQSSRDLINNRALNLLDILHWHNQYPKGDGSHINLRVKVSDEPDDEFKRVYIPVISHNPLWAASRYYEGRMHFRKNRGWVIDSYNPLPTPIDTPLDNVCSLNHDKDIMILYNVHFGSKVWHKVTLHKEPNTAIWKVVSGLN